MGQIAKGFQAWKLLLYLVLFDSYLMRNGTRITVRKTPSISQARTWPKIYGVAELAALERVLPNRDPKGAGAVGSVFKGVTMGLRPDAL